MSAEADGRGVKITVLGWMPLRDEIGAKISQRLFASYGPRAAPAGPFRKAGAFRYGAVPVAESTRARSNLGRELECLAILGEGPPVNQAKVRASKQAEPLTTQMALDAILVGVVGEFA
jgi:hypothetical protein